MYKMNVENVFHDTAMFTIIISIVSLLVSGLYQSPNLLAQSDNNKGIIDLNQPLYREHFKLISQKEVTINGTKVTQAMFSGNGTAKGISITSMGKGLIFPRPDGVVYLKGKADFIATRSSSSNDKQTGKATYTFQAIGNYGIALFNANATGNLSFLSDTVAVYKVDMNSNGTNTFTMWKWGK
jgi:hypothetical protein